LFVATDRISAFDVVLWPGIPDKGRILNQVSNFWFQHFGGIENHLLETDFDRFPSEVRAHPELRGRSVIVRKCSVIPIEWVARGYLVGSGWKEYQQSGTVCGLRLEHGLKLASKLRQPIFTPATKAETGHDENISYERMAEIVGHNLAPQLRDLTLMIYSQAADYAATRGIIIADTKFEFGLHKGRAVWYAIGSNPPSFDKQFVRDWLESTGWDKNPPAPELPPDVVSKTREKYIAAYRQLTGSEPEI
jgi:phosphoribosylaminoimidazole-succinocarboxamide synthase